MGLLDDLAGVADHVAGSVDEAIGRATRDAGNPGYGPDDTEAVLDNAAGSVDESLSSGLDAGIIDTVWQGHDGDRTDYLGPAVFGTPGSVTDVISTTEGESTEGELRTKLLLWGIGVLVVFYVVGPVVGPALELVAGEGE